MGDSIHFEGKTEEIRGGVLPIQTARSRVSFSFTGDPDLGLCPMADSDTPREAIVRLLGQAERHPNDPELFGGLVQACR